MAIKEIISGGVVGIIIGGIMGFIIPIIMTKLKVRNSIKKIRKQKSTYRLNGKEYDFVGKIDKSLKKTDKNFNKKQDIKEELTPPIPSEKQKEKKIIKIVKRRKTTSRKIKRK